MKLNGQREPKILFTELILAFLTSRELKTEHKKENAIAILGIK